MKNEFIDYTDNFAGPVVSSRYYKPSILTILPYSFFRICGFGGESAKSISILNVDELFKQFEVLISFM